MYRSILLAASLAALVTAPAQAAASIQKAAVTALISSERSRGNTDVEQPSCYVLDVWAQCTFGTGGGNAEGTAWLHLKSGKWAYLGQDGGVTYASMMEKRYGIPASVAKKFQARLCPSPCPGA
jgi:opacity protein-like surface antigen